MGLEVPANLKGIVALTKLMRIMIYIYIYIYIYICIYIYMHRSFIHLLLFFKLLKLRWIYSAKMEPFSQVDRRSTAEFCEMVNI